MKQQLELTWGHIYLLLMGGSLFCMLFVNEDRMLLPTWGTLLGFGFFALVAFNMSWKVCAKSGNIICTNLAKGFGANDGINPTCDIRMTTSKKNPCFAVVATGGFVTDKYKINDEGRKRFIVCLPEYIQNIGANYFVMANLRKIGLGNIPPYVMDALETLPGFKKQKYKIAQKQNLYLGLTSTYYGTDTAENIKFEELFLKQTSAENTTSQLLEDALEIRRKTEPPEDRSIIKIVGEDDD